MRMIGADFWELPQSKLNGRPLEYSVKSKYHNEMGVYWDVFDLDEPYIVNLTEARQTYGPGLKGYNNVRDYEDRRTIVKQLGGIWCGEYLERCTLLWCKQYPEHCHEKDRLRDFDLVHNEWGMYNWRGSIFKYIHRR
jgi:hypothetical protein